MTVRTVITTHEPPSQPTHTAAHARFRRRAIPRADGEPWFGFDAVRELDGVPDVLIIPLAGHTRGHAGIAVDTGDGWVLNAGDAIFHHGQLEPKPRIPPRLASSKRSCRPRRVARLDNQRRLRELVSDHGEEVTIFAAHDASAFERLSQRSRL